MSGLSVPTDPCYPLKEKPGEIFAPAPQITENEGQTCLKWSSELPLFTSAYEKLVVVEVLCFDSNILCSIEVGQSLHKASY